MSSLGAWLPSPDDDAPRAGRLFLPPTGGSRLGVLVLPPIGYAHSTSFRLLREVAAGCAERGAVCLRLDPFATGDSPGLEEEVDGLAGWRHDAATGASWLRDHDCEQVAVLAVGLTAALAVQEAPVVGADRVVAVAPVVSGRRHARSLRLLGLPFPDASGAISVAGTTFTAALLDEVAGLRLDVDHLRATPTHLVGVKDGGEEAGLVAAAAAEGVDVPLIVLPSLARSLEGPAEEAVADPAVVAALVDLVVPVPVDGADTSASVGGSDAAALPWRDGTVHERFVTVGRESFAGVLTTDGAPASTVLLLLNSGSDPHTGPGRAWVPLARDLAGPDLAVLRVDLRGWGDSPEGPTGPGRPYDAHAGDDVRSLARWLHDEGWERVLLAGLCAGAWVALDAARDEAAVDGVLALNPQLYWQPGDPVEALMSTTRERRRDEIAAIKAAAAAGLFDDQPPSEAEVWLRTLAERGIPVTLVFAERDDGLEFLEDRVGSRLAEVRESVRIVEVADADHGLHRVWRRSDVVAALRAGLLSSRRRSAAGRGSSGR